MKHTLFALLVSALLCSSATAEERIHIDHYTRCAMLFMVLGYSDGVNQVTLLMADRNFPTEAVEASLDQETARMEKASTKEWTRTAAESCKRLGFGE